MSEDTAPPSDLEESVSSGGDNPAPRTNGHSFGARRISIWFLVVSVSAVVFLTAVLLHPGKTPSAATVAPSSSRAVACLGRVEPEDGVRVIGARSLSGEPSLVGEIKVREGDSVRNQQILALLSSKE